MLGDLLQKLGVILAGAVIWWRPTWQVADPLVTLFFALIVVRTTMGFMGKAVNILLEGAPANVDIVSLKKGLESVEGVGDVHERIAGTSRSRRRSRRDRHLARHGGAGGRPRAVLPPPGGRRWRARWIQ